MSRLSALVTSTYVRPERANRYVRAPQARLREQQGARKARARTAVRSPQARRSRVRNNLRKIPQVVAKENSQMVAKENSEVVPENFPSGT